MRTEEIIKNLNYTIKKHRNDIVGCGQTNITSMCKDILPKMEQLKHYEDLEEQGMLLRLPCKVGDTVYTIKARWKDKQGNTGTECYISEQCAYSLDFIISNRKEFGKTVFLTKEEAEQKLAELKEV